MSMLLTPENLYPLEEYARIRNEFRNKVMKHKVRRRLPLGPCATLYFEDRLTMQYQVQEMLRLERIFEPEKIQEELAVYNPLIPNGSNWKATFMLEYQDVAERRAALARLIGVEKAIWIQVKGFDKVHPIANEDLDRQTADKTSSVHFLRFELTPEMIAAIKRGEALRAGIEHAAYHAETDVPQPVRDSLVADLR
ncbi:MAG: hypothetical protein A2Z95_03635 [Gallionellales bacterium GWA2_60_18]|nr:MAG: hypothetical protein A2Z95_03635 [Gallionellales bacterium GWA2_60_18]